MSVQTLVREPIPHRFNGKSILIHPVGTLQTLRIIGIINRLRTRMKITPEELSQFDLSMGGIFKIFGHILNGITEDIDTNAEDPEKLSGLALTVFREVGLIARNLDGTPTTPETVALAPLDDTLALLGKIAECEAETSLGKQIRAMFANLANMVSPFMKILTEPPAEMSGGPLNGGPTGSSTPSSESMDGQTNTSSVFPSNAS